MKKFKVMRVDDIDGAEATATVQFSYQGKAYEIDLSDDNRYRLEEALGKYISKARPTGRRKAATTAKKTVRTASRTSDQQKARAWAVDHGVDVGSRGRVPANVMSEYRKTKRKKTTA